MVLSSVLMGSLVMGKLVYGPQERVIEVDDRTLTHVQCVIVSKFRRNEAFLLAWVAPLSQGSGRDSIWLHPTIPVQFHFAGNRHCGINRAWLEQLMAAANHGEMQLTDEPEELTPGTFRPLSSTTAH